MSIFGKIRRRLVLAAPTCTLWKPTNIGSAFVFRPAWAVAELWVAYRARNHVVLFVNGRPAGMPQWLWRVIYHHCVITVREYRQALGLPPPGVSA